MQLVGLLCQTQGRRERVRAPGAWFSNLLELKSHTKFKISKQTLIWVQLKIKELNNFLFFPLKYYKKNKPYSTESGPVPGMAKQVLWCHFWDALQETSYVL
jgi:hypothetical protein